MRFGEDTTHTFEKSEEAVSRGYDSQSDPGNGSEGHIETEMDMNNGGIRPMVGETLDQSEDAVESKEDPVHIEGDTYQEIYSKKLRTKHTIIEGIFLKNNICLFYTHCKTSNNYFFEVLDRHHEESYIVR